MADQTISSGNTVEKWVDTEFREWSRGNTWKRLMGTGSNAVIHVGSDLSGKAYGGTQITRSLVLRGANDATLNDNTLWENEEDLGDHSQTITLTQYRHAFAIGKHERRKANFDMLEAMRDRARVWNMELTRDLVIEKLISPVVDGTTTYDAATTAQKNTFCTSNNPSTANQRILFGAAKANSSGVHATDLANIDGTADDMHQDIVNLARRLAQSCDPHIQPAMHTKGANAGKELFYMPMGSLLFRDLQANFATVLQNAGVRGDENHSFSNGDITVANTVCFEVPEMDRTTANGGAMLENVGSGGTVEVGISALMGAQSILWETGEKMHPISDEGDYKNRLGVGVAETLGVAKGSFNSFMHGTVQVYASAVGD